MSDSVSKTQVIYIKMKSGVDLLAFFGGDIEESETTSGGTMVYRPIWIREVAHSVSGKIALSYQSDFYAQFGSPLLAIPNSDILFRSEASDFFSLYYKRSLGELIVLGEKLQQSYIDHYELADVKDAMGDSDSMYVKVNTEYLQ